MKENKLNHATAQEKLLEKEQLENKVKFDNEIKIKIIDVIIEKFKSRIEKQICNGDNDVKIITRGLPYRHEWFSVSTPITPNVKLNLDFIPHVAQKFDEFRKWIDDNDLTINIKEDHDGMGVISWTVFVIEPKT